MAPVTALVVSLELQPAVAAQTSPAVVERRSSSSRKGKHVPRAPIPEQGTPVLEHYDIPPFRTFYPPTDTWRISQNWTLSGRSGIAYSPQRNDATAPSASVSAAPSLESDVPSAWSRRSRTSYYAVPLIVVCSVVLSVAIVLVILMSVVVRQKKAKRVKEAKLEDVEGREVKPDDTDSVHNGRDKLRHKIRRRFRRRRRKIRPTLAAETDDTVQSAADDSFSPGNSSVGLNVTNRESIRLHPSAEPLLSARLTPDGSPGRSTLSRRPSSSSTMLSTTLPREHGSPAPETLSRHTSRNSVRSSSSETVREATSPSPRPDSRGASFGGPRTSTDSHPTSPPAYRPNSAGQRLSGSAGGDVYTSSSRHHERRPSYATAVAGGSSPPTMTRSEEKRRAIDPPGAVDPTELEEAWEEESSSPTDFTAHVSTDDKAALGRLEGLASSAPPRSEEDEPGSGPSAPLFTGDVAGDSIWEDLPEEAMTPPPAEPADIILDMTGSSSLPAPPTPFESAFTSYAVGSTPYPPPPPSAPSAPPEDAEASAPPLNIFADTELTPTAPVLPLYEPRSPPP
jgi:hypothetical protein